MAKNKWQETKKIDATGTFNSDNMQIEIGDEIIDLKDKLKMFNGETIKFSISKVDIIAEE